MKPRTILVIGGALAGPTAAARAREIDEHARILLLERNRRVSYAECGLAYHLSGEVPSMQALNQERAEFFGSVYGIEVWTETEVTGLHAAEHRVSLNRSGQSESLAYDSLVFALGASSVMPSFAGKGSENVTCFRTLDDLEKIEALLSGGRRQVAVIGGGPMGIEAADGLIRGGAEVTLIEKQPRLLSGFGPRAAAVALQALQQRARVITGATVESAESSEGHIKSLKLSSGEVIATDLVISATGILPRTDLLKDAGAQLAANGSVIVDGRSSTSLPEVYACGVCVSVPQVITGRPVWLAQGALADKTAQVAGANASGGNARLGLAAGSVLIRAFDSTVGRTGLSLDEATAHFGPDAIGLTTVHAPSHERYFPHATLMLIQLLWHRGDGRVLGVEAAGASGVDKRIDAASAAVAGGMTIERLASLDYGYEPPYSAARDPLNVAATVASFERAGVGQSIEPEELNRRSGEVQIIDVRIAGADGFAPVQGSVAIPLESLRQELDRLDRSKPIVTVSENGRRGWLAARVLSQRGFAEVAVLSGGLRAWHLAQQSQRRQA